MKPRVFVSSTYYDLKHVRERIEKFIDNYGFESVLFESDKVTYEHGKPMDESAFGEVNLCHIMVLIIGGRYGTSISVNPIEDQNKYESEYVSITRKEFETAVKKNIPIFIFIDKNVYSEYQTYKENQDILYKKLKDENNEEVKFKFAHVDNPNIFRFIDVVNSKPIKTFEKVEEIENYLQSQIAGQFYLYLESLQKKNEVEKVLDSVSELNNITLRMNEMLNSVGKKVLGEEYHEEYEKVISKQFEMIIDFFAERVESYLEVEEVGGDLLSDQNRKKVCEIIYNSILDNVVEIKDFNMKKMRDYDNSKLNEINNLFNENKINVKLRSIRAYQINRLFYSKVKPFIKNVQDKKLLINKMDRQFIFTFI